MNSKRVLILADSEDIQKKAAKFVSSVLAVYPSSILVELDEGQLENLQKKLGSQIEIQEIEPKIKLKTVEFQTADEAPPLPMNFTLMDPESLKNNYWIVQLIGPFKPEWGESLNTLGAKLLNYIPENAYLTEMTPQVKEEVTVLEFVNWVGIYEPIYKISPALLGKKGKIDPNELSTIALRTAEKDSSSKTELVILLHKPSDARSVTKKIKKLGGEILESGKDVIKVSIELDKVEQISKMSSVTWIEPFAPPHLFNDISAQITEVRHGWERHSLTGEGQIVAVADTGLDTGINDDNIHRDFRGRIVNIHDRVGDGPSDVLSGHGTHVAGSVLGDGSSSNGSIKGMAPGARLVFQAIEDKNSGSLSGIPADLNQLFQQAYNDGARIHSNSWGSRASYLFGNYTASSQDIDEFMWNHKDFLILFAAGNEGIDSDSNGVVNPTSVSHQASAKNCITVGASENNRATGGTNPFTYGQCWPNKYPANPIKNDLLSNNPEGMVAFSGRGPTDDGRIKPDVVAPGTNVLSTRSSMTSEEGWGLLPQDDPNHPFYLYMGGTSMSTPITTGTVALIRQYLMEVYLHTPSAALLKSMLIHGATALQGQYSPSEVDTVPDNNQGWGRINLRNTLFPALPVKTEFRDNPSDAVGTGEYREYTFKVVNSTAPFRATLVWTDFPGNPSNSNTLVNTLRLSVTDPNGASTQGGPANNNVQQVVINNPQAGIYKVRVTGVNIATQAMTPSQKQDFAVVASGGLDFVDVYIKDNLEDDGIQPSKDPLSASPDIWVSLDNDPNSPPAAHPEYGQTNYVFIRVHNRGTRTADNAEVKFYWAKGGTNLSRPYWRTEGIKVDGTDSNIRMVSVPPRTVVSDGTAVIEAFEWTPPNPKDFNAWPEHFCLFATVSHPDDPLLQEDIHRVRWEDNLAWKNVDVIDQLPNSESSMEFYIAGLHRASSLSDIRINRSDLPTGAEVFLKIPSRFLNGAVLTNLEKTWQSEGGLVCRVKVTSSTTGELKGIKLKPGENTLVKLEVVLPKKAEDGKVYPVSVEQWVDGIKTGQITLVARTVGTPAYIANGNSKEIHYPHCDWVKKMSKRNKVPFNDLQSALKRGYNGCRFCLREHSTD